MEQAEQRATETKKTNKNIMQVKLFMLPALAGNDSIEELNLFLRQVRVLEIQKEFVNSVSGQYWAFCITYMPMAGGGSSFPHTDKREKIDYRNVLSEIEFERFTVLRKIRKQLADEDAVPPFAVFTDAELAELARTEVLTPAAMRAVPGIGKKKIEKYGNQMCAVLETMYVAELNEEGGELKGENS